MGSVGKKRHSFHKPSDPQLLASAPIWFLYHEETRIGVQLLPLDGMLVHRRLIHCIYMSATIIFPSTHTHICNWVKKTKCCGVNCLAKVNSTNTESCTFTVGWSLKRYWPSDLKSELYQLTLLKLSTPPSSAMSSSSRPASDMPPSSLSIIRSSCKSSSSPSSSNSSFCLSSSLLSSSSSCAARSSDDWPGILTTSSLWCASPFSCSSFASLSSSP